MTVRMQGDGNGRGALTGDFSGTSLSGMLENASVIQNGTSNLADLYIIGSSNEYGIHQRGTSNTSANVEVMGDLNSISTDQEGNSNAIAFAKIVGNTSSLGISQLGDRNDAQASLAGGDNRARLTQLGNDNDTSLGVDGGNNMATLDVTGNDNLLDAEQMGSDNMMDVDVFGSGNNAAFFGAGDARTARGAARTALGSNAFNQGDLWQHGSGNTMTVAVGESGADSNDNAFASLQLGNDNVVNGTIGGGNGNQAVVAQLSNNNSATFTQTGNGNNVGMVQGAAIP